MERQQEERERAQHKEKMTHTTAQHITEDNTHQEDKTNAKTRNKRKKERKKERKG